MLVLRSSPPSPFGRKVKITAALLGLSDRVEIIDTDTVNPNEELLGQNPLGKIPTLVLENGETLFDSRVIVEFLDHLGGGGRIIPPGSRRFEALRQQALADGIMDAGILQIYEIRFRPEEHRVAAWVERQNAKVDRALATAEASLSTSSPNLHIGHVALACALGYLDLRFEGRWRQSHPKLVAWLDDFEGRVPAFAKTRVTPT
jgi:glutathione S-transferase